MNKNSPSVKLQLCDLFYIDILDKKEVLFVIELETICKLYQHVVVGLHFTDITCPGVVSNDCGYKLKSTKANYS